MLDTSSVHLESFEKIVLVDVPDSPARSAIEAHCRAEGIPLDSLGFEEAQASFAGVKDFDLAIMGTSVLKQDASALFELAGAKVICAAIIAEHQIDLLHEFIEIGFDDYIYLEAGPERVAGFLDLMLARSRRRARLVRKSRASEYLLNAIPDLVMVLDREGRYHEAVSADTSERKFLRPPSELLGRRVGEFFPEEETAIIIDTVNRVLDSRESTVINYKLTLEGRVTWFAGHVAPMDEEDQHRVVWIARDITQQVHAESEARDNAALLQAVLDTLPLGIFWKDREHKFLGMNKTTIDAIGANSLKEVIGKSDYDFENTKAHADHFHEYDARIMDRDEAELGILEQIDQPGQEPLWLRTNKVPLHDSNGEVTGVLGTFEDISAERKMNLEHERARANLHASQSLAKIGSWENDFDTDEVYWSPELYRIHDLPQGSEPLRADKLGAYYQREGEAEAFMECLRTLVQDGKSFSIINELTTAKGDTKIVHHHAEFIDGHIVRGTVQDVSESYRLKDEAERATLALGRAQSLAKIGSWELTPEGHLTWSHELYRIHGREVGSLPPEPSPEKVKAHYPEGDDAERFTESLQRCLEQGENTEFEGWLHTTDGKRKRIRFLASRDASSGEARGTLQDISEQYEQEQALRSSQDFLKSVLDNIPIGVYWKDHASRFLGANNYFLNSAGGMSLEEILGKQDHECGVPKELAEEFYKEDRAIIETGEPVRAREYPLSIPGLPPMWLRGSKVALQDSNDERIGVLGTFEDITEEKFRELERRRTQDLLDSTQAIANVGGWEYNALTEDLWWTTETYRMFGLDQSQRITLERAMACYPEQSRADIEEHFKRLLEEGVPYNIEIRFLTAQGEVRWGRAIGKPILRDGKVIKAVGLFQDINEEKQRIEEQRAFEARVQHAQKLESLGVLAGGIAHDFNNLLVSMMGYASMAQGMTGASTPVHEKISNVVDAAKKAADLTKQMLAYSGKGKFVIEEVSINDLVAEMGNILRVTLPKGVILKESFALNSPNIAADKAQISQVVMNLITNAGEAIGERSGIVTLSTGVVNADVSYLSESEWDNQLEPGFYVCLEVSDTGKGMDEDTRSKIFDPFFTTKFTGRGLGLAAVLGIIRGHKGAIRVYSEAGQGTTFKVLLPVSKNTETATIAKSEPVSELKGRALVVDDEESVRAVAEMILEDAGMEVITANDGRDGVEKFAADPEGISVVVLDMTMPHMNGVQAYKELRKIDPDVRVVLSSGYTEQDATASFNGRALAGFIQKPYMPDDLVKVVREALGIHSDTQD